MKKAISLIMALVMALCCMLTACGAVECTDHVDTDGDFLCDNCTAAIPDNRIDYKVTVKNGAGEAMSGVFVMIYAEDDVEMQNRLTMKMTKSEGVVTFKLEAGTYLVELLNTKEEKLEYDTEKITLTEARPSLEMTVFDKLSDKIDTMKGSVYKIDAGSYSVDFSNDEMTYFVFVPKKTGIYHISIQANTQVELGSYGDPMIILDYDIGEHIDATTIKITVNADAVGTDDFDTTKYTVGIKGKVNSGKGALVVKKVGDVQLIPQNKAPVPDNLPIFSYRGGVPEDINITVTALGQRYNAVYNENDGYYHLCENHIADTTHVCDKNGPVIYVRLASDDGYLNFSAMLDAGNGMKCYIYNADGDILEQKDYTEMLAAYIAVCDSTYGIHPLTEDLREAIQNCAKEKGWFDKDNPDYKFGTSIIMARYEGMEYLMFCCIGQ